MDPAGNNKRQDEGGRAVTGARLAGAEPARLDLGDPHHHRVAARCRQSRWQGARN